jgi:hypothetical protein
MARSSAAQLVRLGLADAPGRLVDPLREPGTRDDAVQVFIADLPGISVRQALLDELPASIDPAGVLLPAEHILNDAADGVWFVHKLLQLLAVGAAGSMSSTMSVGRRSCVTICRGGGRHGCGTGSTATVRGPCRRPHTLAGSYRPDTVADPDWLRRYRR